jgi:transcriptional regulator with XRE-family HTH domain
VADFDLPGLVRRIRRRADLSQRELAERIGLSKSAIAAAESAQRGLDVRALARAAEQAGLRLALVDEQGQELAGMADDAVRDLGGRRFPAHLDTLFSDQRADRFEHRYDRPLPWFTFDRHREHRDHVRRGSGTPDDHHPERPGDSPQERRAERRREYWRRRAEERERAFLAGELAHLPEPFLCTCPSACDELDDRSGTPVHAPECPCRCDLA